MGTFAVFEINSTPFFIMVDTCHLSKYSFGQPPVHFQNPLTNSENRKLSQRCKTDQCPAEYSK